MYERPLTGHIPCVKFYLYVLLFLSMLEIPDELRVQEVAFGSADPHRSEAGIGDRPGA